MADSDWLSFCLDESSDISSREILSIICFSWKDNELNTNFLDVIELKDLKSGTIFDKFMECLTKKQIPLKKIVSVATDGAANMTGKHSGFITRLK